MFSNMQHYHYITVARYYDYKLMYKGHLLHLVISSCIIIIISNSSRFTISTTSILLVPCYYESMVILMS